MTNEPIEHSSALRRAIMRSRPDFYAWTDEEQLRYRMNMPDRERFLLERSLLKELCGIDSDTDEAIDSAWRNLPAADLDRINEALLPWDGIGEDCFYLTEFLPGDKRLGFETVDDYARDEHAFQEAARVSEDETYAVRPYQGNLSPSWARLFVDSRFRYATLWNLAAFLTDRISERGQEQLQRLIPYRLVSGPDDGKREGDHYVWDVRRDAGGREAELEELTTRLYEYEIQRATELLEEFDRQCLGAVFIQDAVSEADHQIYFIFSDKSAMAATRFRHFLRDCRNLERDGSALTALEGRECAAVDAFLDAQHRDILQHFDPKVTRMTKRRRVLVHKDAFR